MKIISTNSNKILSQAIVNCLLILIALASTSVNGQEEVYRTDEAKDIDHFNDSVPVFICRFSEEEWDINYDQWPDGWMRSQDMEHASYARIAIEPGEEDIQGNMLVIHPDGSSVKISSPPIHVLPKFSYIIRLKLKESGIEHGDIKISLGYYNSDNELLQLEEESKIKAEHGWKQIEMGEFKPRDKSIDRMKLHIEFNRGKRVDLSALLAVAEIELLRQPSIEIYTDSKFNVYTNPEDVVVTCELSGIKERNPELRFQLLDATNRKIGNAGIRTLEGDLISEEKKLASDIVHGYGGDETGYEGKKQWHPPIKEHGFYRVRVQMLSSTTGEVMSEPAITIAVVPEGLQETYHGEFGWSLTQADYPLSFKVLQDLLPLAGVNFVKIPVWFPINKEERGNKLLDFSGHIAARGIEMVGIIDDPTERIQNPLDFESSSPIESFLTANAEQWLEQYDHVITKLSLQVRWWQLGLDDDTSFVGASKIIQRIRDIRNSLFRFGQDTRLGIGWRWDYMREWDEIVPWDFQQMSYAADLNSVQLDEWMRTATPTNSQRWVAVAPHDETPEGLDDVGRHQFRVRDFVEQIIVAKINNADGIYVINPFSGLPDPNELQTGVMNIDGTPGELLLPWRTCARLLSGASYIGSQVMPKDSKNWIFKRPDGSIVMVLWNHDSVTEKLYLGDDVEEFDIWGKSKKLPVEDGKQVITVNRMPRFLLGLNEEVAEWRMNTQFAETRYPSVFGIELENAIQVKNTFGQGVVGGVRVHVPADGMDASFENTKQSQSWNLSFDDTRLKLSRNESADLPILVNLFEALYGKQPVRIDFEVDGDKTYRFSVWRKLHVGRGDIKLAIHTELTDEGRLVIRQEMQNNGNDFASFKCQLYAPPSRRKRVHVYQLGNNIDKKTFTYVDGSSMIGRDVKLRIEEVDGDRVLIYRFVVDPERQQSFYSTDEGFSSEELTATQTDDEV